MANDVTRHVSPDVERELWARAAGRCQFNGCNRLLYKSRVTQERVNVAQKAHIYSFSVDGPRGRGPLVKEPKKLNEIANLMLVCHGCHRTIDQDKRGTRYSAALLRRWKKEHEERIVIVTGIRPNMKSHVVLYGANIGEEASRLNPREAADALFPHRYPASDRPVALSMQWAGKDADPDYWKNEERNLVSLYDRSLRPILEDAHAQHCSVFALAPMPLLVKLGSLLTDKAQTDVYQLHREPQTWKWLDGPSRFSYRTIQGRPGDGSPVLIISLSDRIAHDRVRASVLDNVAIWELTVAKPGNDFLRSREQLAKFRQAARDVIAEIGRTHGKSAPLRIFPAMPVACAVELGRIRMPKADSNWTIYDYNNAAGRFNPAVVLGAQK